MSVIESKLKFVAKTGGIKLECNPDKWLNPSDGAKVFVLENLDTIKKWVGKSVMVEMLDDNTFSGVGLNESQDGGSLVKPEHVINISGRDFVTHNGLLDVAHSIGLKSVESVRVTDGVPSGVFMFKSRVVLKNGGVFEAFGDASSVNVSKMILPHVIRMAETRAVSRALRLATNVGMTAFEELGDVKDDGVAEVVDIDDVMNNDLETEYTKKGD